MWLTIISAAAPPPRYLFFLVTFYRALPVFLEIRPLNKRKVWSIIYLRQLPQDWPKRSTSLNLLILSCCPFARQFIPMTKNDQKISTFRKDCFSLWKTLKRVAVDFKGSEGLKPRFKVWSISCLFCFIWFLIVCLLFNVYLYVIVKNKQRTQNESLIIGLLCQEI